MDSASRHIYMANQIARNFGTLSAAEAARETAAHIMDFWDPRMIKSVLEGDRSGLSPVATEAMTLVEAARNARAA